MNWVNATKFPETATHALDFGPGGLSGIGPLTSRNLEGRGVRVIVIGDKAKGTAELFDAESVKKESWWKQYTPGLVKTRYVVHWMVVCADSDNFTAMAPSISTRPSLVSSASPLSWLRV